MSIICYSNKNDDNEKLINRFLKKIKQSSILREYKEKQEFIPNNEKRKKKKDEKRKKIKEKKEKDKISFNYFDSHKIQNNSNINIKYYDRFYDEDILFDMPYNKETMEVDVEKYNLILSTCKTKKNKNEDNNKNNKNNSQFNEYKGRENKQYNKHTQYQKNENNYNKNNQNNQYNPNNKTFNKNNNKKYKIINGGKK